MKLCYTIIMTHVTWPTLCIFGDSIVMGTGAEGGFGWPLIFNKQLISSGLIKHELFPLGISGDTVTDVLSRVKSECQARLPRIIILAIGLNDTMTDDDGRPTPIDKFKDDYQKVIAIAKEFTDKIILVGINRIDERASKLGYRTDPKEYDAVIKKIAQDSQLPFIDIYSMFSTSLLFDGAHPNNEGHRIIASLVVKEVEKLIR